MRFWKRKRKTPEALLPLPPKVYIHESVLPGSLAWLQEAQDERSAHEGIIYWAGKNFGAHWVVTTCIAPRATTTRGSFETSAASNAEVIGFLATQQLELLAQVHSHPGQWVDHSDGDSEGALMPYEHFLSIIAPNYGRTGIWPLTQCGVHRFERGKFRRLANAEIESTFRLVSAAKDLRRK